MLSGSAASADQAEDSDVMDIQDFVSQVFIEGVNIAEASKYASSVVPTLLEMLGDPEQEATWANVVVVLGIIGDESAVNALIEFIDGDVEGSMSRSVCDFSGS